MKINKSNTTFVMGFWSVPQNMKHSYGGKPNLIYYENLLPKTLKYLENQNIVFFRQKECPLNLPTNMDILYKQKEIADLTTYSISQDFLKACKRQNTAKLNIKEKGRIHHRREYKTSGEEAFMKVFTIWTSKLFLLKEMAIQDPFQTKYFAWCDVSWYGMKLRKKTGWDFLKYNFSFTDYIKIYNVPSTMRYRDGTCRSRAGFMLIERDSVVDFVERYERKLKVLADDAYCHDEETILTEMWKDEPGLFGHIR